MQLTWEARTSPKEMTNNRALAQWGLKQLPFREQRWVRLRQVYSFPWRDRLKPDVEGWGEVSLAEAVGTGMSDL